MVSMISDMTMQRTNSSAVDRALRFGCRLFAFMTPEPDPRQDVFIRQCLVDGDNALRQQSAPDNPDSDSYAWERITHDGLQDDGWGMAFFGKDGPMIRKAPVHAHRDNGYIAAADEVAKSGSGVVLAHLREGQQPKEANTHPFRLGRWVFMHNGTVPPKTLAAVESRLIDFHRRFGTPLPLGNTDTERVFLYLMGRLREKCGAASLEQLEPTAFEQFDLFKETMEQLIRDSEREIYGNPLFKWLARVPGAGGFVKPPGLNFILSDGNRLLASCYGRKLYLGFPQGSGRVPQGIVLASRRIQPACDSGLPPITWQQVPDRSLLLLERDANGMSVYQANL